MTTALKIPNFPRATITLIATAQGNLTVNTEYEGVFTPANPAHLAAAALAAHVDTLMQEAPRAAETAEAGE